MKHCEEISSTPLDRAIVKEVRDMKNCWTERERELERRLERLEERLLESLHWLRENAPGRAYAILRAVLEDK